MVTAYDHLDPVFRDVLARRRPDLVPSVIADRVHGVVLDEYACPECERIYGVRDWQCGGRKVCPQCSMPLPQRCLECKLTLINPVREKSTGMWYDETPVCGGCVSRQRLGSRKEALASIFPRYAVELASKDRWVPPYRSGVETKYRHRASLCRGLQDWAKRWQDGDRYSLWVQGNVGPGKTVAVVRYAGGLYAQGHVTSVAYITEDDLCDHASSIGTDGRKDDAYAYRDKAIEAELLVWDECNSRGGLRGGRRAHLSDVQERWIISVAKARLDNDRPTIYITNANAPEEWESLRDPRCRSRLMGAIQGHMFTCQGPDMRTHG